MKKIYYFAIATALGLGLTACSSEEPVAAAKGDGVVTFTAQLPSEFASRAFNDGKTATTLTYAVYETGVTPVNPIIFSEDEVTFGDDLTATVTLQLVNGKTYDILFWADAPVAPGETNPFTFTPATQTVAVNYAAMASNNDACDAFFAAEKALEVEGAINKTVTLTRPFAQINFGTDDLDVASVKNAFGITADNKFGTLRSKLALTAAMPDQLNLLTGEVTTVATGATAFEAVAPTTEEFPYEPLTYDHLSMTYVLVGADRDVVDLKYTVLNGTIKYNTLNITAVPVQRNYRTNIYGSLITSKANYNVEIKPGFAEPDYDIAVTANTPSEFTDALVNPKVEIINVSTDLDLSGATTAELTFSNDKTINMTDEASIILPATERIESAGSDLTVVGGRIANVDAYGNPIAISRADDPMKYKHKSLIHLRDGVLTLKGVELVNDMNHHWHGSQYNSAAIAYWGNCEINIEDCRIYSGEFTLCGMGRGGLNTSKVYLKNSYFESNSSNADNGQHWAYCMRLFGTEGVLENCEVKGIQGAVSTEEGTFTFKSGKYYTVNSEGKQDAFYAVYATGGSKVVIEGGDFYGPIKRTGLDIGGTSCVVSGDNDTGIEIGSFVEIKGGRFSGKAYVGNRVCDEFNWVETSDSENPLIKWTVAPAATE